MQSREEALLRLGRVRQKVQQLEKGLGHLPPIVLGEIEESLYQLLIPDLRDLLSIHAPSGEYLFVSPNAEHFFGWRPEELLGRSAYDLFHHEDLSHLVVHSAQGERGLAGQLRYRLRGKAGIYRWVETRSQLQSCAGGAQYLVCRTRDLEEEVRTLQRALAAEHALVQQLEHIAYTDPLTQLPNRGAAEETLAREIAHSQRHGSVFSVAMLDLDHFKRVNDTHGHAVGDQVLAEVARTLGAAVRAYDYVARWGGEEFLVIFPDLDQHHALEAAQRACLAVAQQSMDPYGSVTLSGGVAQCQRQDTAETLLQRADHALYRAKAEGRNCIRPG